MKKQKVKFWQMLLLFGALLLFSPQIYAQIKGKVTDSSGIPLPGVTIMENATKNGTITDFDGNYQIKLQKEQNAVLVFSFVGMETQEIKVNGISKLNVVLLDDSKKLEEVVVVAYGTQKKVSVTGAIASVNTKDVKQSPSANFVGALSGRLPGLITVQNSGQPGAESMAIYLRGASTTNGQSPLILIDGVPRDNLTQIDPNEVASVSILKDASATAVFGVRGANGVILITTKRGDTATPQLSVSAEYGLQDFTRYPKTVDSWDWATQKNQALLNDGLLPKFTQDQIDKYRSGVNPYMYPNNNWVKLLTKSNSPMSRYNVNISGGTERVKYFMNASYTHQGGMFNTESKEKLGYDPQYKMDRYNFRTNLDIKMNSWIKSTVNLAGYIENVNSAGSVLTGKGNPLYIVVGMYQLTPDMPGPVTIDGYGSPTDQVITSRNNANPSFGNLNRSGYLNSDRANLTSSLAFDFDLKTITKGLTSKVMVSFDSKSNSNIDAWKDYVRWDYALASVTDPITGVTEDKLSFTPRGTNQFFPLSLSKSSSFMYTVNMQWAINYARAFGKHSVTGMMLAQRDNSEIANGSSDLLLDYNVLGVASRLTYDYDNRYLLEVNGGYNGSEQFAKDRRFGFFPAASVGWVISNEKFMQTQKVITNLKLRASYGKVGNDELGNERFLYLDNVSVKTGGFSSSLGGGKFINEDLIGNPLITWETSYKQNYGIDLKFLKDFTFTADYFIENRDNILLTRGTVPTLQGLPLSVVPKANLGKVDNKGFELELAYAKIVNKDLSFNIRANYNYNQNTVINMDEAVNDPSFPYKYSRTGYSLSQNWGYEIDYNSPGHGYYTSQDEVNNSGLTYDGIQPKAGDFVYKDINGDKIINTKDYSPIKYGNIPRITYGANLSVSYKGIDVSALLQGTAQSSNYYSSWGVMENPGDGNYYEYMRNAWTKELYESGAQITYPRLTSLLSGSSSSVPNSFFIMDKSYLRLKNAEIGYTLSKNIVKRIGASKVRLYVNGQNLFVWDNLPTKNFDPEQANATTIPIVRVFNLGANIVF